jgi:hypothetical protein
VYSKVWQILGKHGKHSGREADAVGCLSSGLLKLVMMQ